MLTSEEEINLAERIKFGDRAARDELILANVGLVKKIARKFVGHGIDFDDLIQEGNIGLMKAVKKFDHRKGYKFSTYAFYWIFQTLVQAINNYSRTVRLPGHIWEEIRKYTGLIKKGYSLSEISQKTGVSEEKISNFIKTSRDVVSFDVLDDSGFNLYDKIGEEEIVEMVIKNEINRRITQACEKFSDREKWILKKRFGMGMNVETTYEEIGHDFGITHQRVKQIEKEILRKLKRKKELRELQ